MKAVFITCFFLIVVESNGQFAAKSISIDEKTIIHKRHTYPTPPHTNNSLFYIQRSSNTSAIVYDGKTDKNGDLIADDPVDVYWMGYAQDSLRNELSFFQKKFGYGVNIYPLAKKNEYEISLVSYKKRKIRIFKSEKGNLQANMLIDGKMAKIKNVYVEVEKNLIFPEIAYVEMFGEDLESGREVYERIIP